MTESSWVDNYDELRITFSCLLNQSEDYFMPFILSHNENTFQFRLPVVMAHLYTA